MASFRTCAVGFLVVAALFGGGQSIDVPVVQEVASHMDYGTTFHMTGTVDPNNPWKFSVSLSMKSHQQTGTRGDIAFFVEFGFSGSRAGKVITSARKSGAWLEGPKVDHTMKPGDKFDLKILILKSGFTVLLDDCFVISRPHILHPLCDFEYFVIAGQVLIDEAKAD